MLLTFDDSVNDLNREIYRRLFEQGRTNPNGCPILSTFYVSHEWTDYSQVQNLYSKGHEIASHSVRFDCCWPFVFQANLFYFPFTVIVLVKNFLKTDGTMK